MQKNIIFSQVLLFLCTFYLISNSTVYGKSLQKVFSNLEHTYQGRIGVYAINIDSNETIAYGANQRFPMSSTFKIMVCAAILDKSAKEVGLLEQTIRYKKSDILSYAPVTRKHLHHGMTVRQLCEATIATSDNTAANVLIDLLTLAVTAPLPQDAATGLFAGLLTQRCVALINPFLDIETQRQHIALLGDPVIMDSRCAQTWTQHDDVFALPISPTAENRPSVIIYSSGSSGTPKAIIHSETSLSAIVDRSLYLYPQGVDLISMPMHSLGGIQCLFVNLAMKRCLGLMQTLERQDFCKTVLQYGSATVLCFPSYAAALLDSDNTTLMRDTIDNIHTGGEKLTAYLHNQLETDLACRVYPAYGMAEFGPIAVNRSAKPESREAIGELLPGVEMRLHPLLDKRAESQIGELCISGCSKMLGYLHTDGRFEQSSPWLKTGDIVRRSKDGTLWHMGRKSDSIRGGDHIISLSEIERQLIHTRTVKDVAVVKKQKESFILFIVPEGDMGESLTAEKVKATLDTLCKGVVGACDIVMVDALPLNAAVKVDRMLLQQKYERTGYDNIPATNRSKT